MIKKLSVIQLAPFQILFGVFFSSNLMADGGQVFGAQCARCHTSQEMTEIIHNEWLGESIYNFFLATKNTMPAESPGSLSDQDYHDVVKFMLNKARVHLQFLIRKLL